MTAARAAWQAEAEKRLASARERWKAQEEEALANAKAEFIDDARHHRAAMEAAWHADEEDHLKAAEAARKAEFRLRLAQAEQRWKAEAEMRAGAAESNRHAEREGGNATRAAAGMSAAKSAPKRKRRWVFALAGAAALSVIPFFAGRIGSQDDKHAADKSATERTAVQAPEKPVPATTTEKVAPTPERLIVTSDAANMRAKPSTDSAVVWRLYRDTEVTVLQREGEWVKVAAPGATRDEGWIHSSLLGPLPASR
jgi:dTMP kinase